MYKKFTLLIILSISLSYAQKTVIRTTNYPVDSLFVERWSPRAMSGESISDKELMTLFEAARWAPSSYNDQPWHFVYAKRDTPQWDNLYNSLVEFNQSWTKHAAALIAVVVRTTFAPDGDAARNGVGGKPSATALFDAGAAWQNLALQGYKMGLVVHGMGGFDTKKATKLLNVPEGYEVIAFIAVGKPGPIEQLPEYLHDAEKNHSGRRPIEKFVFEGEFKK